MELMNIETNRLHLRGFESSDVGDLFEYLSLPETYRFEPGEPLTLEQTRELLEKRRNSNDFLAVILKSENKMVGHLYYAQVEPVEWFTFELGYIFNPKYQRKGFASEAVTALVAYAFDHLQTHRILARCDPENVASWRALEKVGFVREGHYMKNHFFHRDANGNPIWKDAYEYSLLEKE